MAPLALQSLSGWISCLPLEKQSEFVKRWSRFEFESLSMSLSFQCQLKQLSQQDFPRNTSTHSQICKQRRENKLCLQRGSQKLLRIVSHLAKPACHNSHLPDSLSQPSKAGEQSNNEQLSTPGGLLMLKSQFFLQDQNFLFSGRTSGCWRVLGKEMYSGQIWSDHIILIAGHIGEAHAEPALQSRCSIFRKDIDPHGVVTLRR